MTYLKKYIWFVNIKVYIGVSRDDGISGTFFLFACGHVTHGQPTQWLDSFLF